MIIWLYYASRSVFICIHHFKNQYEIIIFFQNKFDEVADFDENAKFRNQEDGDVE